MAFVNEISCFLTLAKPTDLVSCFVLSNGSIVFNLIYIALLAIIVGGWSYGRSINEGMMLGGLLSSLMGLGLIALGWISVKIWMLALIITLVGIGITVIKKNSKD